MLTVILKALSEVAESLGRMNVPEFCHDDDGCENNHWTGTRDEMVVALGRRLLDMEVTVLSLSRAFGPIPSIPNGSEQPIWDALFPNGNECGCRLGWQELAEKLDDLSRCS